MNQSIRKYFKGIAAKRLSEVEIRPSRSNQHEFNGTSMMRELLGSERRVLETTFLFISDDENSKASEDSTTTWYDAREKHSTRIEYRLYYKDVAVLSKVNKDDLLVFCLLESGKALVILAPKDSTIEKQVLWLFGLLEVDRKFIVKNFDTENLEISFARNYILESIGFEVQVEESNFIDLILAKFGGTFPSTEVFSTFSRSTLTGVSAIDDPDLALILWMQQEEKLFKVLEKYLVEEKLKKGFGNDGVDVDDFINYSLSIHQRRKSRAGWAFDHHVAEVLRQNGVLFSRQSSTEGKNKPDYIFPSIQHYKDPAYLDGLLTMLALKTTAKDRWRQILPEANRIKVKNLLTLEPSISIDQTNEMKNASVKLVVPKEVKLSYTQDQQDEILDMRMFISEVLLKQNSV